VPEDFLLWANQTYGNGPSPQPTRVLLEVDDPASEQLKAYLKEKSYDTNKDQLRLGGMANTLKLISAITGGIGGMFVFLSFAIFLMNFQLIISRAKYEIGLLLDLGYTPKELANTLNKQFLVILLGCVVTVLVVLSVVVAAVHALLVSYGFETTKTISWIVPTIGVLLLLMLQSFINWGIKAGIKR
jgi:hypothetical protein